MNKLLCINIILMGVVYNTVETEGHSGELVSSFCTLYIFALLYE
jgi:hypothetical protein